MITFIVIIRLMLSLYLGPKVITLSSFHCITFQRIYVTWFWTACYSVRKLEDLLWHGSLWHDQPAWKKENFKYKSWTINICTIKVHLLFDSFTSYNFTVPLLLQNYNQKYEYKISKHTKNPCYLHQNIII